LKVLGIRRQVGPERKSFELSEAEDGQVFEYEFRLLHCDGTWRWINAREMIFTRMSRRQSVTR